MDTLAFGYILPTTGWILDLHQLETCAAERTSKKRPHRFWCGRSLTYSYFLLLFPYSGADLTAHEGDVGCCKAAAHDRHHDHDLRPDKQHALSKT